MSHTIAEVAELLGLPFQGDGTQKLSMVSNWQSCGPACLVFLESKEPESTARPRLDSNALRGACLIARRDQVPGGVNAIFSEHPKLDFARAAALLHPRSDAKGIRHTTAVVSPSAQIDDEVDLGPRVTVGAGASIGKGTILHAAVTVGEGCSIGQHCVLHPHVVLYPGARLGNRVILHAGAVVGSDGFGYVCDGHAQVKFPQTGSVIIEDDVEIGANTTIDRGSLGITRIGAGSKIDNLVQIAHNVEIGKHVVIAAQTGISGSTVIEDRAVIGGQVGFGDHARVQQGAVIGSKAGILPGKIVRSGEIYWGVPIRPLREYKRLNALFSRLPEMKAEIESLKRALACLKESILERDGKQPE